ncbi:hypothetical protein Trydic_g15059 [Trypoxylus dichotomus]
MYAHNFWEDEEKIGKVERGHHSAMTMVWWGVAYGGVTQLHFCKQGVKTLAGNYQIDILEKAVKPLNDSLFAGKHWVFQQVRAALVEANLPEFIAAEDWPSRSPDLNPLDYRQWNGLEEKNSSEYRGTQSRFGKSRGFNIPLKVMPTAIV